LRGIAREVRSLRSLPPAPRAKPSRLG